MTIMQSIDRVISAPARKLSDFAHARKKGSDQQIAVEITVASNIAIIFSASALGHYLFAAIATIFFIIFIKIGGWKPEMQAFRPPSNDLNRLLSFIIAVFGSYTVVYAGINENVLLSIMGTAFLVQLMGDQMLTYRREHG